MGSAKRKSSELDARNLALYEMSYKLALASLRGYGWKPDDPPRSDEVRRALARSRTTLPVSSTMQTLVSLTETSSPAKWSMLRFSLAVGLEGVLQTELQTNHAVQYGTKHHKPGSSEQKWRTEAHA